MMHISVIIATHNQKERLRLVLVALQEQQFPTDRFEIVVVNDGSRDGTEAMLDEVGGSMSSLRVVNLEENQGRCKARNRGAAAAKGQLLAFLDGDALPHPEWLQHYWDAFTKYGPHCFLCGFESSLPDLEYLQDPQTGTLLNGQESSVIREFVQVNFERMQITEEDLREDFEKIHQSSVDGGYPFSQAKEMQEQIIDLFETFPDSPIAWIGFFPHNGAIPRSIFHEVGGFDEEIPFSEGWELSYRLQDRGFQLHFITPARTYHLYHFHNFSDPGRMHKEQFIRHSAIRYMAEKLENPKLLCINGWLAGIWSDKWLPDETKFEDLRAFHHFYQEVSEQEMQDLITLYSRHPLWKDVYPTQPLI